MRKDTLLQYIQPLLISRETLSPIYCSITTNFQTPFVPVAKLLSFTHSYILGMQNPPIIQHGAAKSHQLLWPFPPVFDASFAAQKTVN